MKKYSRQDQKLLATWSLDCAERVLPGFAAVCPGDARPADAIEAGREWVRTGVFSMRVIRAASLAAHAAAKDTSDPVAKAVAHAAGQAVATAHVAQHAYGGAYYALRAVAARPADREVVQRDVGEERAWQSDRLPAHLRNEIMDRITAEPTARGVRISLRKGPGF